MQSVTQGAHGTVSLLANGQIRYTPGPNFNGIDSFTYRVEDPFLQGDTATVTVNVTPVNDDPVAQDDSASTVEGTPVVIDLLANDSDLESAVQLDGLGVVANGSLVDNGDGTVTYTPDAGFSGVDGFVYTIRDDAGATAQATASISVARGGVAVSSATNRLVERHTGSQTVQFDISRNAYLTEAITLTYVIVGSGLDPVGADDVAGAFPVSGSLTIPAGQLSGSVTLDVTGDLVVEAHETMRFTLTSAATTGGDPVAILDAQHQVTIVNDDAPPVGGETPGNGNSGEGTPPDPNEEPETPDTPELPVDRGEDDPGPEIPDTAPTPPTPPARPENGKEADVWGDPHLVSFDGLAWDFHAVGEFVLVQGTQEDDDLLVQARFTPINGSRTISSVGAVATEIDGHSVAIYRTNELPDGATSNLLIDGVSVEIDPYDGPVAVGDGEVWKQGNNVYLIVLPSGEQIMTAVYSSYMNVCVFTDDAVHPDGTLTGLLGNGDGLTSNDKLLPDGTVLTTPTFNELYTTYATAWRIEDSESLFTYSTGEGTADHTDESFPDGVLRISDFSQAAIDAATAIVDALGISNPILRDNAILDFLITGNPGNANAANTLAGTPVEEEAPAAPPVVNGVTVSTVTSFADEGQAGDSTGFEFIVSRTGDTSEALTLGWTVVHSGTDDADFGGTLPTGSVAFAAGEDTATVIVTVSGDDVAEGHEAFGVRITLPDGAEETYLARQTQAIIENDDGPLPSLFGVYALAGSVTEGNGSGAEVRFQITRSRSTLEEDSVTVSFSGLDAADFAGGVLPDPVVVTFLPGEDVKVVSVTLADDATREATERLTATLSDPQGGTINRATAGTSILDDDNADPVATDDSATLAEDAAQLIDVLANDTDAEGDSLSLTGLDRSGTQGQVSLSGGQVRYDPGGAFDHLAPGETATDSFGYSVSDGHGGSDSAQVTVTITGVNTDPTAGDDSATTAVRDTVEIDVLANDSDPEGAMLAIGAITGLHGATATIDDKGTAQTSDDTILYTAAFGTLATEASFSYEVLDGTGGSHTATVTVTLLPIGDVVDGTDAGNILTGTFYNDTMQGGGGSDLIYGSHGADVIWSGWRSAAEGMRGNDYGRDTVHGEGGDDSITGSNGASTLVGGEGNDTLYGGNDLRSSDTDLMDGGAGDDLLISGQIWRPTVATQGRGDDMRGGLGNDTLLGGLADDDLQGGAGDDSLQGGGGDDWIYTGLQTVQQGGTGTDTGNDTAFGGDGADSLIGSDGADLLFGEAGNDSLNGGIEGDTAETDSLYGGAGEDVLVSGFDVNATAGTQANGDYLSGGAGVDEIWGGTADDTLIGGADGDQIVGGGGNDVIYTGGIEPLLHGGASLFGYDWAQGGFGDDLILGSNGVDLLEGNEGNDTLSGGHDARTSDADSLYGGAGDDVLYSGMVVTPTVDTQTRGDALYGEAGHDTLVGGQANDLLVGGSGNDRLTDEGGMDTMTGGAGADTFVFRLSDGGVDTVTDWEDGTDMIELMGFDPGAVVSFAQSGADVEMLVDGVQVALFNGSLVTDFSSADYFLS